MSVTDFTISNIPPTLARYIERKVCASEEETSRVKRVMQRTLQSTGILVIAGARIGMTMICLTGSSDLVNRPVEDPGSLTLGALNAVGAIVSFGFLSAFSMLKLVDEVTRHLSSDEQTLIAHLIPQWKRNAIKVVSIATGILAQSPIAYGSYKAALVIPPVIGILNQLDFSRAAYSTYMTLKKMAEHQQVSSEGLEPTIFKAQKALMKAIQRARKELATSPSRRDAFLQMVRSLNSLQNVQSIEQPLEDANETTALLPPQPMLAKSSEEDVCSQFLNILLEDSEAIGAQVHPAPLSHRVEQTLDVLSAVMLLAILAQFFKMGEEGSSYLEESILPYFGGALVVLANCYLWFSMVQRSTLYTVNLARGAVPASVTAVAMPRFYKGFTYVGVPFAFATFVPSFYFSEGYSNPPWLQYAIGSIGSVASILAGIAAVHALRDLIIRHTIRDANGQLLLDFDSKLERLGEVLSHAPPKEIARFLLWLKESIRAKLVKVSTEDLTRYIRAES